MARVVDEFLVSLLREQDGDTGLPERFCAAALAAVDVSAVTLTLTGSDEQHLLLAASDPLARRLWELESSHGEGPAWEAGRTGTLVLVEDLADVSRTSRWPTYAAAAGESPLRSQFSFPLQIGVIRLGVMTLYRERPEPLSEEDLATALVLADAATVVLLHLQDVTGDGELHADLGTAFDSSAELHQATGMVSVQAAVGMSEALLLLQGRAFSSERTPLAVARDVLAGIINFIGKGHDDQ